VLRYVFIFNEIRWINNADLPVRLRKENNEMGAVQMGDGVLPMLEYYRRLDVTNGADHKSLTGQKLLELKKGRTFCRKGYLISEFVKCRSIIPL